MGVDELQSVSKDQPMMLHHVSVFHANKSCTMVSDVPKMHAEKAWEVILRLTIHG